VSNKNSLTTGVGTRIRFQPNFTGGYLYLGEVRGVSLNPETENLEHFAQADGVRRKDRTDITQRSMMYNFTLEHITDRNLLFYLMGTSLTSVDAGSVSIANEAVVLTGTTASALALQPATGADTGSTVTNDAGTTTYAAETEQTISAVNDGSAGSGSFEVTGDVAALFPEGRAIVVSGSSTAALNGTYTVSTGGATHDTGTTTIDVDEVVAAASDGTITSGDYVLSVSNRNIGRAANSMITSGDEVLVTYNWDAPAHTSFAPHTADIRRGAARVEQWPRTGSRRIHEIPNAELRPDGENELDPENWQGLPMVLDVLDNSDVTPNAPYGTIRTYVAT